MKNVHSESGVMEDLIRSIVQLICSEGHLKSLIEKTTAELENGLIDIDDSEVVLKATNDLAHYQVELEDITGLRRKAMLKLYNMGDNGDKKYWCQVKHMAQASFNCWEAYCGSEDDTELYALALGMNEQFIRALTHFLGFEITTCAACYLDAEKAEEEIL